MISYQSLYSLGLTAGERLGDVNRFRRVNKSGFNETDSPDQRFFKLLFYFYNDLEGDTTKVDWFNGGSSGLLSPTWLDNVDKDFYKYNSAWAYLKANYEEERANSLKKFVNLLSQISSESPWYFQEVTGVEEALTRENWKVSEERKKISIKCLNDPIDHRIESLLSLYRSIVWSQTRKCEVLPANLRKFDMGMFIFSGLTNGVTHTKVVNPNKWNDIKLEDFIKRGGSLAEFEWNYIGNEENWQEDRHTAPYKYLEFHNCEISMDSIKSGYSQLNNGTGFEQEFTIDIYFDECYENEYNPYIMNMFGDFFEWDAWTTSTSTDGVAAGNVPIFEFPGEQAFETDSSDTGTQGLWDAWKEDAMERVNNIKKQATTAANAAVNSVKNAVKNAITGGLGNIYGKGGGIEGTLDATEQALSKQVKTIQNKLVGNINDTAMKLSKAVVSTVANPVLGTINKGVTIATDAVDRADGAVTRVLSGNQIGKNRLKSSKLGNIN
jgi:hypothetical protein